jgi:hypothetical protein
MTGFSPVQLAAVGGPIGPRPSCVTRSVQQQWNLASRSASVGTRSVNTPIHHCSGQKVFLFVPTNKCAVACKLLIRFGVPKVRSSNTCFCQLDLAPFDGLIWPPPYW